MPIDLRVPIPSEHRHTCQLRPVVTESRFWFPASGHAHLESPCEGQSRERAVRHQGQAFAAEVISDG